MSEYDDRMKDYVDVAERLRIFRERHPEGSLQPLNLNEPYNIVVLGDKTYIVYIAAAYRTPDDTRPGIGSAWEMHPGKTPYTAGSELMNAETAAWGRAILAALAADSKRIASLDEVQARREMKQHPANEQRGPVRPAQAPQTAPQSETPAAEPRRYSTHAQSGALNDPPATDAQERALYAISKKLDRLPPAKGSLTKKQAGAKIEELQAQLADQDNGADQ
jgi:hypothetical protein